MQEFAQARARLAAAAMPTARAALSDKPGRLEGLLHEAVRQRHLVLPLRDLMGVPDVEAAVAVARPVAIAIQREHPLHFGQRRRAW